jgi:hypothetical protein
MINPHPETIKPLTKKDTLKLTSFVILSLILLGGGIALIYCGANSWDKGLVDPGAAPAPILYYTFGILLLLLAFLAVVSTIAIIIDMRNGVSSTANIEESFCSSRRSSSSESDPDNVLNVTHPLNPFINLWNPLRLLRRHNSHNHHNHS